jgi:hypothetical protein
MLVGELVAEVRHSQAAESKLRQLLKKTYAALPAGKHTHLASIPGIGDQTAAILVAKIINIDRFATPEALVGYFGIFPEQHTSGVDKKGRPLPPGTMVMSPRGNDLVRGALWMAALSGVRANPALRALFRRLKAKGKRGDVAMGHCMRKLLHLIYAVWQTGQPFNAKHYPWLQEENTQLTETTVTETTVTETTVTETMVTESAAIPEASIAPPATTPRATRNEKAVGHKRDQVPEKQVVTTAPSSVKAVPVPVNPASVPAVARPKVDFVYLRQQVTMEQVLGQLGIFDLFKGTAEQRRGPCPVHAEAPATLPAKKHTCSVQLGKNLFHCFKADCAAQGNVLDLWAAIHHLPLYEAALHLADTFHLPRNREEAPVLAAQHPAANTRAKGAVITPNGG